MFLLLTLVYLAVAVLGAVVLHFAVLEDHYEFFRRLVFFTGWPAYCSIMPWTVAGLSILTSF